MSYSLGLVDFTIGLVNYVLNLPDRQVKFLGELKLQMNGKQYSSHQKLLGTRANEFGASICYLKLTRMPSCKTDFGCTLRMQLSKQNKVVSYNYYKKRLYGKRRKAEGNYAKRNMILQMLLPCCLTL